MFTFVAECFECSGVQYRGQEGSSLLNARMKLHDVGKTHMRFRQAD